jgi:hypothetical protein
MYQIPGCPGLEHPKEEIINHARTLRRGRCLDGALVGLGFESIPDSDPHGTIIDASLALIDEMGRGFSTPVRLFADCSAKLRRAGEGKSSKDLIWEKRGIPKHELIQS